MTKAVGITRRQSIGLMAAASFARPANAAPPAYDVAVVGAGVFGMWSAERLRRAGARVVVIDQYGPANARSSSGGESRVIRISYGANALYSGLALESLAEWKSLSAKAETPLFHPTGVLWFSPAEDDYMAKSLAYLEKQRIAHRRMDAPALREAYPQMRFADGEAGFLEEETGAVMAARAVRTLAASVGVEILRAQGAATAREADAYEPAPAVRARTVIYACGPWLPKLFPELLEKRIVATRQEVLFFGAAPGDRRFAPPALPVWADFNDGEIVYGIPDLEGQGFKLAFDAHGEEIDPDTEERRVGGETIARARDYLARRFPDLAGAPLVHSRVCQYENTSNGDFLIDRHPDFERVWLVGGGSGHGFKHGPAVGRIVADCVLEGRAPPARFALASKGITAQRSVY